MRSAAPRTAAPPVLLTLLTVLALFTLALLIAVVAKWRPLMAFDGAVVRTTHQWAVAEPELTRANRILTDWVWDPWTMRALTAAVVVWLWWRGARRLAVWLGAATLLGSLVSQAAKAAVGRDRPSWPDPVDSAQYAAFPSGHAMAAAVAGGLLLWVLRRRGASTAVWRTALVLTAVSVAGVGLTRVWLGVHWPSDVVGGWLLGALTVTVTVLSYGKPPPARTGSRPGP
ncbi:phosphatase PAP2 family protein [Streptomyces sp. NPDC002851]